jgi:hypothetical protein
MRMEARDQDHVIAQNYRGLVLACPGWWGTLGESLWRNWQTRMVANYLGFGSCGFESRRRHASQGLDWSNGAT